MIIRRPYSKDQYLKLMYLLVKQVDDNHWGTDTTLGAGDWWNSEGGSTPYAVNTPSSCQTTNTAAHMVSAICVLEDNGMATDLMVTHAKAAVAQLIKASSSGGAYDTSNHQFLNQMNGTGSGHPFIYCWVTEALCRAYNSLSGVDRTTIASRLVDQLQNTWSNYSTGEKAQSLGTSPHPKWWIQSIGLGSALGAQADAGYDDFFDTSVMASGGCSFGDFTFRYSVNSTIPPGTNINDYYKAYYHALMCAGLLYRDAMEDAAFITPSATQNAQEKCMFAHLLGSWMMNGLYPSVAKLGVYREWALLGCVASSLAAIVVNENLRPFRGSERYARYLCDRWVEQLYHQMLGPMISGPAGSAMTVGKLSPVFNVGTTAISTGSPKIEAPNSYTIAPAELAMRIGQIVHLGDNFFNVVPAAPNMAVRWSSAMMSYHVNTPRYSAIWMLKRHTSTWPETFGPEPAFLFLGNGECIHFGAVGSPQSGRDETGALAAAVRAQGLVTNGTYNNVRRSAGPDSAILTDGSGATADALTALTAYDVTKHNRDLRPGYLPSITVTNEMKNGAGQDIDTGEGVSTDARGNIAARWDMYRDFAIRRHTYSLIAGTSPNVDHIVYFSIPAPCRISISNDTTEGGWIASAENVIWDGASASTIQGGIGHWNWILYKRDSRGGTSYDMAWCWVRVHASTALGTGTGGASGLIGTNSDGASGLHPYDGAKVLTAFQWRNIATGIDGRWSEWALVPLPGFVQGEANATTAARADNAKTFISAWAALRSSTGGTLKCKGFQMFFANGDNFGGMEGEPSSPMFVKISNLSEGTAKVFYTGPRSANVVFSTNGATGTIEVEGIDAATAIISIARNEVVDIPGVDYTVSLTNGAAEVLDITAVSGEIVTVFIKKRIGPIVTETPVAVANDPTWVTA